MPDQTLQCAVKGCGRERVEGSDEGPCPYHYGMWAMWALLSDGGATSVKLSAIKTDPAFWLHMGEIEADHNRACAEAEEEELATPVNRDTKAGEWLCLQGNPHKTKVDAMACSRDFMCDDPGYGF